MAVEALTLGPLDRIDDPRRQPVQPLRLMSGHIPASLFGPGAPLGDIDSFVGALIDQWLFP
ncbi:MAG: hypothetical protein K0V04_33730 [Deltaproteobacteria bacterium]|nr:hypothetical protein [Deltaproteobacteria bacterium]